MFLQLFLFYNYFVSKSKDCKVKLAAKATLQQHRGSKRIKINKELKTSKKQKSKKGKL